MLPTKGNRNVPDEPILRAKARAAVESGKLPNRRADRTWGGPGVGAECAVCELPVTKDQMEFEIEFARDGDTPGLDKFHVHVRCFAAWEFERARARRPPRDPLRPETS
jgi:hypothetical protein